MNIKINMQGIYGCDFQITRKDVARMAIAHCVYNMALFAVTFHQFHGICTFHIVGIQCKNV